MFSLKKRLIPLILILVMAGAFFLYAGFYYHADETALAALGSDDKVSISRTDYGWFFNGPSEKNALVFYPGGKVEETAYAPLLHKLAAEGLDVCLVKMPFHLAVFGIGKADRVIGQYDYENWYIGGHSLGGAMASVYAAEHPDQLIGLILCAAYPSRKIPDSLTEFLIYGSEDRVLNRDKVESTRQYAPSVCYEKEIEGGNHAQFGNYGIQSGDGPAAISANEQQEIAVQFVMDHLAEAKSQSP